MKKIKFTIPKDDVVDIVKTAVSGKFAILKDEGYKLKVGAPMLSATITIGDGELEISGSGPIETTCGSEIEMAIKKAEKEKNSPAPSASANAGVKVECDTGLDVQLKAATLLKLVHELFEMQVLTEEQYDSKKKELIQKLEIINFDERIKNGKCPYCGEDIDDSMDFCGNCGNKLR